MDTALNLLGAFLVIDLLAAFGLVVLVWMVQRGTKTSSREQQAGKTLIGVLIFLAAASGLIYLGIWLMLCASRKA